MAAHDGGRPRQVLLYRDTYRIVTQVSRYVSHREIRYRDNTSGYPQSSSHVVAPLNGAYSARGAIFRTTKYTVYANVITTQPSFWRHQALISGPCDQHFSDSHQNPLGFIPKARFFCRKYKIIQIPKIP